MTNLNFLDDGQSISSAVSQLHIYFQNTYSKTKLDRAALLGRLELAEGDREQELLQELRRVDDELVFFGILSDSLSTANRVLHSRVVAKTLGIDAEVYQVHLETDSEQALERAAAQRRVANHPL